MEINIKKIQDFFVEMLYEPNSIAEHLENIKIGYLLMYSELQHLKNEKDVKDIYSTDMANFNIDDIWWIDNIIKLFKDIKLDDEK